MDIARCRPAHVQLLGAHEVCAQAVARGATCALIREKVEVRRILQAELCAIRVTTLGFALVLLLGALCFKQYCFPLVSLRLGGCARDLGRYGLLIALLAQQHIMCCQLLPEAGGFLLVLQRRRASAASRASRCLRRGSGYHLPMPCQQLLCTGQHRPGRARLVRRTHQLPPCYHPLLSPGDSVTWRDDLRIRVAPRNTV